MPCCTFLRVCLTAGFHRTQGQTHATPHLEEKKQGAEHTLSGIVAIEHTTPQFNLLAPIVVSSISRIHTNDECLSHMLDASYQRGYQIRPPRELCKTRQGPEEILGDVLSQVPSSARRIRMEPGKIAVRNCREKLP